MQPTDITIGPIDTRGISGRRHAGHATGARQIGRRTAWSLARQGGDHLTLPQRRVLSGVAK